MNVATHGGPGNFSPGLRKNNGRIYSREELERDFRIRCPRRDHTCSYVAVPFFDSLLRDLWKFVIPGYRCASSGSRCSPPVNQSRME